MATFQLTDPWADYMEAVVPLILAAYPRMTRTTCPGLIWGDSVAAQFPAATVAQVIERMTPANGFAVDWLLEFFRHLTGITPRPALRLLARRAVDTRPIYGFIIWRQYREYLTQQEIDYLVAAINGSNLARAKQIIADADN